jgi:Ca-activated chloride channel family protein
MTHPPAVSMRARADRQFIRPNDRSHRFVLVELTAPPATQTRQRPPVNLGFVIDRSGSMSGQKLELAKRAVLEAIERLDDRDRFSVVAYDDEVRIVVERTDANQRARREAIDRLRDLGPGGSTNLSGGWFAGCEQVAARQDVDAINRVLLLTDGLANVGITDIGELGKHAGELRARGITTTTFGIGSDFDEVLLQSMADAGGGHFYYIADAAQIRDHIASEVGETLEVVARGVALEITPADGVRIEAVSPHPVSTGSRPVVSVGDLVADQVVEVVLRLTFPYGDLGRETRVMFGFDGPSERLVWTYADDGTNDAQPRDREVDRAVARQFAARARQEAVQKNRGGDYIHARWALDATAARIRKYTNGDPELRAIADDLEREAQVFAAPMAEPSLKEAHFAGANMARSRDAMGRSLRRNS